MVSKLALHAKESPIRTLVQSSVFVFFIAHQSGPWLTGRTPEDPLVQDSLRGGAPAKGGEGRRFGRW